jgi:hypothetical protein
MPATRYPLLATFLRQYFYSGWAFLIPYLAAYLLYYVTAWPVNPAEGNQDSVSSIQNPWVPPLLHIYWALHALHLILVSLALRSWWQKKSKNSESLPLQPQLPNVNWRLDALLRVAPWAILALIFYIPGVYLEWPADPWEHLRRINEWHLLDQVAAHSSWKKSSYFLPYSLTGHATGLAQLTWLNVYYTAVCLLVSWQYYRLARAAGLGERASFVFVLLNALNFGNNVFSFYRYYGLSSSILAQLGAVALTRITLETLGSFRMEFSDANLAPPRNSPVSILRLCLHQAKSRHLLQSTGAALALLLLIAFNHIQGIGISGLGILAIIVWRLIAWKRAMIGWLALAGGVLSVIAIIWFPRHPALDEVLVPSGWLTSWYGFAIFSPHSHACERALQILGVFGIANLVAAGWLLYRNHIVGWLCLMPIVSLALPFITIPYASVVVASTAADNILTFHRMLLSSPAMLAIVAVFSSTASQGILARAICEKATSALAVALAAFMVASGSFPQYNRFWHSLVIPPSDLNLTEFCSQYEKASSTAHGTDSRIYVIAPPIGSALQAINPRLEFPGSFRPAGQFSANALTENLDFIGSGMTGVPSPISAPSKNLTPQRMDASTWIVHRGPPVGFLTMPEEPSGNLLQNAAGESSEVFSSALIPISPEKTYHLEVNIRQATQTTGVVMLAVAWHDQQGRLLESNVKLPAGAGMPRGWSNGTYSYFGPGLVLLPTKWTTYSVNFGRHEKAAIPHQAHFIRIGALLNSRSTPAMVTQLSGVKLTEIPSPGVISVLPSANSVTTAGSQAAVLSAHWPGSQAIYDRAGIDELQTAIDTQRPNLPASP